LSFFLRRYPADDSAIEILPAMAEDVPKYDAERQDSLTGVAGGLANEDDAAVLGV
jgi:hypothetical protein